MLCASVLFKPETQLSSAGDAVFELYQAYYLCAGASLAIELSLDGGQNYTDTLLTLTNQRVLFWQAQEALILSDIHIGKTAHCQQHARQVLPGRATV